MTGTLGYEIDIRIDDARWAVLKDVEALAETAVTAAMGFIDSRPFSELSIALLDDARVQALNMTYRQQDKPTNVLSFPIENSPLLGDIVLAFETVAQEARDKNIDITAHVQHLLVHGFYHLQGYDHQTDSEAMEMENLETRALKSLGLEDPYAIKGRRE